MSTHGSTSVSGDAVSASSTTMRTVTVFLTRTEACEKTVWQVDAYCLMLAQMHRRRRDHSGPEVCEAGLVHAEQVLKDQLRERGWTEAELGRRHKGGPEKV